MTTITITNESKEAAEAISNGLCHLFRGTKSFVDDEILVSGAALNQDTNRYQVDIVIGK